MFKFIFLKINIMLAFHAVFGVCFATFVGIYFYGDKMASLPLTPLPTAKQLSTRWQGAFHTIDNNNKLEYFSLFTPQMNNERPKTAVVIFNGRGTGYGPCRVQKEEIQSVFIAHPIEDIQLLCISLPGTGASDPLNLHKTSTKALLNSVSDATLQILREKSIKHAYALGISSGTEFAFNFAQTAMLKYRMGSDIKAVRIKGVVAISPQPFPSNSYAPIEVKEVSKEVGGRSEPHKKLIQSQSEQNFVGAMIKIYTVVNKALVYFQRRGESEDAMFFEKQMKYIAGLTMTDEDIAVVREDLSRVDFHYLHSRWFYAPKVKGYDALHVEETLTNYNFFNNEKDDVPVHVYSGEKDERTGRSGVAFLMKTIKHASLYHFKGGYFEYPLGDALQNIIRTNFGIENRDYNERARAQ